MPRTSLRERRRSPDPPSNGGDDGTRFSIRSFIAYLKTRVDSLDITEEDISNLFERCGHRIILTRTSKTVYDNLKNIDDLLVTKVGKQDNSIILLASTLEIATENEKNRDNVYIQSGALVETSSSQVVKIPESIDYDFYITNSEGRMIIAISDSDQQDPSTLLPTLDDLEYITTLTTWVSKGEEELIVNREDHTIVDYEIRSVDENDTGSSNQDQSLSSNYNYLNRIITDIDSETSDSSGKDDIHAKVPSRSYISDKLGTQKEYTPRSHDKNMDITDARYLQADQLATVITGVATVSLLIISYIRITNVTVIDQLLYYILVAGSSGLLIGSMIYQDFVKE